MKIDDRSDLNAISSSGAKGTSGVAGSTRHDGVTEWTLPSITRNCPVWRVRSRAPLSLDAEQRAANTERLRLEVAQGSYRPDPADISRSVVKDALASAVSAGETETK